MQGAIGNTADDTALVYKKLTPGRRFRGRKGISTFLETEVSAVVIIANGREKKARNNS